MQAIRLDQDSIKIQLAEELPENCSFVVVASGVAGLTDSHAQGG